VGSARNKFLVAALPRCGKSRISSFLGECVAMARNGRRQAGGRPEAGMNEEASAGKEVVQN